MKEFLLMANIGCVILNIMTQNYLIIPINVLAIFTLMN
jgi:hypothetical protein